MLNRIEKVFVKESQNIAFCIQNTKYTYNIFGQYVLAIRKKIKAKPPTTGLIGLIGYNNIETYASILAIWMEGYAFVPISTESPKVRNDTVMKLAESDCILTCRKEGTTLFKQVNYNFIYTNDIILENEKLSFPAFNQNQLACILFTSGSTGIPKGVPYTFNNINTSLDSFFALGYQLSNQDRFLQMFDLTFDMSMLSYLTAWCLGASVYTIKENSIRYLAVIEVLQNEKITVAIMVPSTITFLSPYLNEVNLPAIRYSMLGGEPLLINMAKKWLNAIPNAELINLSGPCETTMASVAYNVNRDFALNKSHNNILAFGRPWKNTQVIIVDENLNEVATNEIGELCFSGENVMSGYWQLPALNKQIFFDKEINYELQRFYRSGDLAYIDEDGDLYSCGRKDFQYKIKGYKVELGEIEALYKQKTGKNAVAIVNTLENNQMEIYLFIEENEIDSKPIMQFLKDKLPNYMIPKSIISIAQLPTTISGKVDRKKLLETLNAI